MKIVMMGIQGSGKGTQSKLLAEHLGVPHVSTGDVFRKNISEGTDLGRKVQEYTDKGELVPDAITIDMVRERLDVPDAEKGFILDGFPRNGVQLAALEYLKPADHAVLIELDEQTAIERLGQRSECVRCGILYGANRRPRRKGVCDECGQPLKERTDDKDISAVRQRLRVYYQEVDVMVRYYEWKGALRRVPGDADVQTVCERIKSAIAGA